MAWSVVETHGYHRSPLRGETDQVTLLQPPQWTCNRWIPGGIRSGMAKQKLLGPGRARSGCNSKAKRLDEGHRAVSLNFANSPPPTGSLLLVRALDFELSGGVDERGMNGGGLLIT